MPKKAAVKTEPEPTREFVVLSPLHHDGDRYAPGETIELTDSQANRLIGLKAIQIKPELPVEPVKAAE